MTATNKTIQTPQWAARGRLPLRFSGSSLILGGMAALVGAALLLPLVYLVVRAIEIDQPVTELLLRPRIVATLARTLGLAAGVTALSLLIAVPLGWLTVRSDVPLRRWWALLALLPLVIPSYVGAYLFASAFGPRGLLQQLLGNWFAVERLPSIYGFPGALLTLTSLSYPYLYLAVRGMLLRLDPAQEEAARSLGDSAWRTFWRVTLPLLRPALGAGGLLVALYCLRDFGAVALMRYDTFTRVIYVQYSSFDRAQAALLALVLVAMTLVMLWLEARLQQRVRMLGGATGAARPPAVTPLGRWRWPALAFCALVVLVSLALPALLLAYWLARGLLAGEVIPELGRAAWNSIWASGVAALCTTLAALPVAWLAVRRPNRLTRLLERLTYAAYALPGIVIALALVFFGINHARWLYQTLAMLVLAYGILFVPQAVGTLRASLLQIHPSLEEAALSLGRRPGHVLLTVTLPLLRPGMLSGAGMVFLTAMKELPATLLLSPLGFDTLAMAVWAAVSEAFFAAAAAPALAIMLLSSLPMALLLYYEQTHDRNHSAV
jgi:iron(III) transport system permease protein